MMTRKWLPIALTAIVGLSMPIAARAESIADALQGYFVGTNSNPLGTDQPQTSPAIAYGKPEPLTVQQTNVLQRQELQFPQSYQAVISKLGYPNQRDSRADYYDLAGGGKRVAIVYSGATAVSVEGI
jgi:hypothetical protein